LTQAFGSARAEDLQKLNLTGKQVAETLLKAAEGLPKVARGLQGEIDGLAAKWEGLKASGIFAALSLPAVGIASGTLDAFSRIGTEISDALNLMSGIDPAELRRRQADVIAGLEKEKALEKEKSDAALKATADAKKLQEAINKGNEENRALDAARWQWEEQFNQEQAAKKKQIQDDAKKAADQAISDAKELLSLHEDTVRKIKSVQEAVYSAQQFMAGSDAERLANAKKALEAEGDVLMGDDPGGFDALSQSAFEDAVKNGRNVTEGQIEEYNRIIALKEEILGLEESITNEAKNGKAELRDQNREAVQRSIEKAGRTPAERKQEMRDNNDMQRQRRRAFNDDVRDEVTRLKKEAEEKNKGKPIMDRERTDREAFKEAAKGNITKKWQNALPEAAQTLTDIKGILQQLAAA
jgi:hypothetical protein